MSFRISCGILLSTLTYIAFGKHVTSRIIENEARWNKEDTLEVAGSSIFPQYRNTFTSENSQIDSILGEDKAEKDLIGDYTFDDPASLKIRSHDGDKESGSFSVYSYNHQLKKRDHHHEHSHHGHHDGHDHGHHDHGHHDHGHHGHHGGHDHGHHGHHHEHDHEHHGHDHHHDHHGHHEHHHFK